MEKYKYLLKNIGILTLSSFATKFISFFLLPLYTGILTTEEYGIYDICSTTITLLYPIFSLCIADATIRFLLDSNINKNDVLSIAIKYSFISIVAFGVFYGVAIITNIIPELTKYPILLMLWYVFCTLNSFFSSVARGFEKIKCISFASLIASAVSILLNILFLVYFKWGLKGYFLATLVGSLISNLYYFFSLQIWKHIRLISKNKFLEKDMRNYGSSLMINTISWWVNSSLDKYIVLLMCGISANGIISIAYKLPSIIKTIQNIFENAWMLSAVKTYDNEDKNSFFINTYNTYNFFVIILTSGIIVGSKIMASALFKGDFYNAWKLVPFYAISVVFSAESGFLGGVFAAVKKTKIISNTTLIGAIANASLNLILIFRLGVIGAAVATMLSNCIVLIVRMIYIKKIMNFRILIFRDIIVYIILAIQTVFLFMSNLNLAYLCAQMVLLLLIVVSHGNEIKSILIKLLK